MAALTEKATAPVAAAIVVGGVAVAEAVYRLLARWRPLRSVGISLRMLLFTAVVFTAVKVTDLFPVPEGGAEHIVVRVLAAALVLLAVIAVARLLGALLVMGALGRRAEAAFPTLVRQIFFLVIVAVAVLAVLYKYFQTPPSALLASSVVISAVVGLSLQQTLGSVAAGVALQSERVFSLGDWVGISDLEGEVVRMTWRTIHLRTRANDVIVIPNDHAARSLVINYSRPSRVHAAVVEVGTHYRHSPDLVRGVLREATLAAKGVLPRPEPHIWAVKFDDFAVRYQVKFYLDDYAALPDIEAAVISNIWYHFRRHEIQIPFPIRTVSMTPVTARTLAREEEERVAGIRATLRAADLFEPLSDDEIDALARRLHTPTFGAGEMLFAQGERGDTCFLLQSGRVAVRFRDEKEREIHLAELAAGAILGEMSLLTGEARSASAVALEETAAVRIGHEDFAAVLRANPQIAEALAAIIDQRQASTAEARKAAAQAGAAEPEAVRRRRIVRHILRFFGLRKPGT